MEFLWGFCLPQNLNTGIVYMVQDTCLVICKCWRFSYEKATQLTLIHAFWFYARLSGVPWVSVNEFKSRAQEIGTPPSQPIHEWLISIYRQVLVYVLEFLANSKCRRQFPFGHEEIVFVIIASSRAGLSRSPTTWKTICFISLKWP